MRLVLWDNITIVRIRKPFDNNISNSARQPHRIEKQIKLFHLDGDTAEILELTVDKQINLKIWEGAITQTLMS